MEKMNTEETGDELFARYLSMNPAGTKEQFEELRTAILRKANPNPQGLTAVNGIVMNEKFTDDQIREMNEQNKTQ